MPANALPNDTIAAGADGAPAGVRDLARRIAVSLGRVLNGKPDVIETTITTLLAGGHLLLEDVPGVGKTTLATALARSIDVDVRRIQFTSDMLPTDLTGLSIYDQDRHEFRFHPGPVFTNIAIGDEVNRATPKTQSALLEAMGERRVTVDGRTHQLPELFIVIATQNPQDMEGTFPLPEAQRDRFMARISLGYPDAVSELSMLKARGGSDPAASVSPIATAAEVLAAQRAVSRVHLADAVGAYLVAIVSGTRTHPGIALGGSPRATLHLASMARARAAVRGRDFVSPDDVAALAGTVLPHRLAPNGRFASDGDAHAAATSIVAEIVARTAVR
ncbi:MoxR family ATPase [Leucobacter weissii]|uniref:MoxR family ATPase n=1 Tax=Leucobacter weissii TaxID=1983706 RepID=A0A939SCN4_9MICO|nr:MoxR family ATPase [Leucobacter weissii]MBO1902620.1 MoxR family ATPase [Leucobacter weissii]